MFQTIFSRMRRPRGVPRDSSAMMPRGSGPPPSRRLDGAPPRAVTILLPLLLGALATGLLFAGCSDDDGGGGDGGATGPCDPGEHRYYCTHTVIAPVDGGAPLVNEWTVDDVCGESGDYDLGTDCDVIVNGDDVSFSCSEEQNLGGECVLGFQYDVSGTVTSTIIDLDGTIELTVSDGCPEEIEPGSYVLIADGTAVSGPDEECGSETFTLSVTKPGHSDLTLNEGQGEATYYSGEEFWNLLLTATADGLSYVFSLTFPPFAAAPATFDVVLSQSSDADATLTYSETQIDPPQGYVFTMGPEIGEITSGRLTIDLRTDAQIFGSFQITGSGEATGDGGGSETRTLTGSFALPYHEYLAAGATGPHPTLREASRRALLGAICAARMDAAAEGALVQP
ncbi:MAG: hypothetical protein GF330_00685 [Candidatus Eisenbacteria bacterium]|nr:hypothetical protein [Candidatus Eisenbacteria bacterium]